MTLETPRLLLTEWQPEDWIQFRCIATDPEVMRYITGGEPWSDEQIQRFVNRQIELIKEKGFCRWKLIDRKVGELIGFCGVGYWQNNPDPEIGWWLARSKWGQGLATEAGHAALKDIFERVKIDRIISIAQPANQASTRIMEKLGMQFEEAFERDGMRLVRYAISR